MASFSNYLKRRKVFKSRCWYVLLAGSLLQFSLFHVVALPDSNTIEFDNCLLSMPGTIHTTPARCGWLEVAENPVNPEGDSIKIHVALATAVSRRPNQDPLFLFAGGPGQAASEAYVMLRPVLEKIRKTRDVVLVDQRGTGKSNPLKCPAPELDSLDTNVDLALVAKHTSDCLEGLNGDPRYYTTTIAMQDYDLVRQAMGYKQINLLGISYGTRAAQVYLRHYPDHVRSIILDSVVPMELSLGQEHAEMLDRALEEVFKGCEQDEMCSELYAAEIRGLDKLIHELREQPREITFAQPTTGKQESLTVSADVLAFAIRFLSYSSNTQAVLPLLIHEAVTTGKLERLSSQALIIGDSLSKQISNGMEMSVICSEDFPYMSKALDNTDTLLGNTMIDVIQTQCEIWPRGEATADFHKPVVSNVPTLILTGTRDPVTPASYAESTARHFSNSLVLTANGLGHAVITNKCLREIAAEFIEQGKTSNLDSACVEQIRPAPFFSSILGPSP